MDTSPESDTSTQRSALSQRTRSAPAGPAIDPHIARWGGVAGLAGVIAMLTAVIVVVGFGLPDASAVLHVSTSPLSDLYTASDASESDRETIEYVWHGTQSVFDMMLVTGVLLVPIGIVLLGVAMRSAAEFGVRLGSLAIGLGTVGTIGAAVEIIDRGVELSAVSVLAIVVFHLVAGWRTFVLGAPTAE